MATQEGIFSNYGTMRGEGTVVLSAAGAVSSYRGDGVTVVKNGTGLYDITIDNPSEEKLVEVLSCGAHLIDTAVGTVKDVGVKSEPSQSSTTGKFAMTIRTVDAAGADVNEATNALSVSFSWVLRVRKMTNPFS
jgi:hypothetical protein